MFIAVLAITAVGVNLSFGIEEQKNDAYIQFGKNIEALADPENDVDYTKGYANDPQDCEVSETVRCEIPIEIPKLGINCTIGFSYTVSHPGTKNYCLYTAGGSGCSYHECKINGSN